MAYEVRRSTNNKLLGDFIGLPYLIYKNDPNWVAPMISEVKRVLNVQKNPYFKNASLELFNCYKGHTICSRVAIIINTDHHRKFGKRSAFFGFFESQNDLKAIKVLFEQVEKYCKEKRVDLLEGPFNPNHYSELGLLVNKLDSAPAYFQTYNPSYYHQLLESTGFQIIAKFHTRKNENIQEYIEKNFTADTPLAIDGFSVRSFRFNDLKVDLEHLRNVFNDAFSQNWHFLPLSREEYLFSAKYLSLVTNPDLIQFVEYFGQPVGAIQFVLDINPLLRDFKGRFHPWKYIKFNHRKKKIPTLIIFAVGIRKEFRHSKALYLLTQITARIASEYKILETTWTSHDNIAAVKAAEQFGLQPDKEYVIYERQLQ
jgi:hypothetical protein